MKIILDLNNLEPELDTLSEKVQHDLLNALKSRSEARIKMKQQDILDKELVEYYEYFNVRILNILITKKIRTVKELVEFPKKELKKIPGFGQMAVLKVNLFLAEYGFDIPS